VKYRANEFFLYSPFVSGIFSLTIAFDMVGENFIMLQYRKYHIQSPFIMVQQLFFFS